MSRYVCPDCGYIYDEATGEPHQGYAAGTVFNELPPTFVCPDCYVRGKEDFLPQND
ncbi:MAG: rubredoxin [Rhodocyclaceae bacterium]|jgi:rubredoxin|nr:rubredoxin [Rhodocyclaceae bacterium]MBK6909034.1 rubredoxin [Rhodocyclaceae bacterium]